MRYRRPFGLVLLVCLWLTLSVATAQSPTIITVTAPDYLTDLYEDTLIPQFEAEYPNIQVQFVRNDNVYGSHHPLFQPEDEENTFFEDFTDYASSADVLYVTNYTFTPFHVNTGFYLDLTPLVAVDEMTNAEDFYPAAWQAYQWDGGMWALPYSLEPQILTYDRNAFDDASLPYPDESWRFSDFILAVESLQTYNDDGEVELSPINTLNPTLLMHNEIGNLYDISTLPAQPDFSSEGLVSLIESYNNYYQSYEFADFRGYSYNELPMSVGYPYQLSSNSFFSSNGNQDWAITLLPGGTAGSRSDGFAISSGTTYPEAAYAFVSFMTRTPDVFSYGAPGQPARRTTSLEDMDTENSFYQPPSFDLDVQAILDQAYEVAIPSSDLMYTDVFFFARDKVDNDGLTIEQALEEVRQEMMETLEEAGTYQSIQLTVAAPTLPPDLAPDEIELTFGLSIQTPNSEREALWQDAIAQFVSDHPRVGSIDLDYRIYGPSGLDEKIDCWFNGFGGSFQGATEPPEDYLALSPLMTADPDYDSNDFLPGVLDTVTIGSEYYGYPLTVQPIVMWINTEKFEQANVPLPINGWTINEFTDALMMLAASSESDSDPVVRTNLFGQTWLTMIIASYGGVPIDFTSDPATYNLTEAEALNATQQVVNLIRDGLIDYTQLVGTGGIFFGSSPDQEMIVIDLLGDGNFSVFNPSDVDDSPLMMVTFPTGTYTPVAYSTGNAHINSATVHVQECYDWIRTLASQPELFRGMPSRPMLFDDPQLNAQESDEIIRLYRKLADSLTVPNTLTFVGLTGGFSGSDQGSWLEPYFFYYAMDNAVLNDAELEPEMRQAEENLATYRQCTAGIEQVSQSELMQLFENNEDEAIAYQRQFIDCAVTLIPEIRDQFSFYYQDDD